MNDSVYCLAECIGQGLYWSCNYTTAKRRNICLATCSLLHQVTLEKDSKIIKLMCLLFVSLTQLCWQTPKSYINNTSYHIWEEQNTIFQKVGYYCTHPFNCNTGMDDDRGIPTSFRCETTGRYQHVIGSTYTRYVLSMSQHEYKQRNAVLVDTFPSMTDFSPDPTVKGKQKPDLLKVHLFHDPQHPFITNFPLLQKSPRPLQLTGSINIRLS